MRCATAPLTGAVPRRHQSGARANFRSVQPASGIDSAGELRLVDIGDERAALALQEGSVIARVRDPNGAGELDLSTEEGRFVVPRAGSYRFDRQGSKTDLTVYAGQARYEGPEQQRAGGQRRATRPVLDRFGRCRAVQHAAPGR